MVPAGAGRVQDLLRARADLPTGHPDRATLREHSIEAGLPLARQLASRYRGRGVPVDDLHQVAALALVKAVDAFDPARQVAFSSYATPSILGALKRHFRDHTWLLRVPRPIRDLATRLGPARAALTQQLGRSPTLSEFAAHLAAAEQDVAIAQDAWRAHRPDSLDALPAGSRDRPQPLIDTLGTVDRRLDAVIDWHTVRPLMAALPDRQRRILALRYFGGLTQTEIAAQVGLSQMHVSRLLERTLTQLRTSVLG
jgi:RNA polymerase sigma-B factor